MKTTYGIIEEKHNINGGERISYGVAAYADCFTDGSALVVETVSDISSDRESIEEFVDKCNSLSLSPEHLRDAVEDFLAEKAEI